ncbi:(d)CMP kinase [Actinocorallia sp. API 0066]|uniref:(d)CMP kinase n=1 Tax=Actinocorallia sp. API 0066 TaxID=2896846 RepID=UPI001E6409C1|nr:(d)CMP kinase [Actinocorallia sp. API 0066]MCD0450716.1 (d)CMP kinase [Actinocorallia sp. API 0066]
MSLIIAMDGPSGSGKSSAAKGVARVLGYRYLDTGAMYRAVTWWMLDQGVDVEDAATVALHAAEISLEISTDPDNPGVVVGGVDVTGPIRSAEVTRAVSAVSRVPEVRGLLVRLQREIMAAGAIVAEGRDIGTVVAPDAPLKVFLTASEEARAARRAKEIADPSVSVEATLADQARRDKADSTRATSPLTRADDAVEIDSTELGLAEVVDAVVRLVKERA